MADSVLRRPVSGSAPNARNAPPGSGDSRGAASTHRTARSRRSPFLRILAVLGVLALLAGGGYAAWVYIPPALKISAVLVSGNVTIPEADILLAAAIGADENILTVDTAAIQKRLAAQPRIEKARVSKLLPSSLAIMVMERKPVACLLVQTDGGLKPVLVDIHGVVYMVAEESPDGLPVISGIRFDDFLPGQRLPAAILPVLAGLKTIGAKAPALMSAFSEIRVVLLPAGDIELLLYPVHVPIPVRTLAVLDEKTLRSVILVLDILKDRHPAGVIGEVDFRTGTAVYRTKEGQPG